MRFLLADADGIVAFDSHDDELVDSALPDEQLDQGVGIVDWNSGDIVGTVIVATGEGFYRSQEEAFLNNVVRALLIGGAIATVGALIVGWLMARQISAPVTAH